MTTPLKFHWFLPTNGGDGRHVVSGGHGVDAGRSGRPASVGYLGQVTRSAEQLGFEAALTPTGAWCEDAWLSTAMLSSVSERLKFLVAFRPGLTSPTLAAQMAAHLPEHVRRPAAAQRRHRRREPRAARVRRLPRQGRPLRPVRRVPRPSSAGCGPARPSTSRASTSTSRARRCSRSPTRSRRSTSAARREAAGRVAAKHVDVYLTWGEPPAAVEEKVEKIRKLAADEGREIRFGIRMHTIARDTSEEAWAEADRLLAGIDDETIANVQAGLKKSESEGQRRMLELNQGSRDRPRDLPQRVGRRRPGPRRGRHRAGRAATRRSPTGSRSTPRSGSRSSSSRRTRTSRAPTGSARACCRSSRSAAGGRTRHRLTGPARRCRSAAGRHKAAS